MLQQRHAIPPIHFGCWQCIYAAVVWTTGVAVKKNLEVVTKWRKE